MPHLVFALQHASSIVTLLQILKCFRKALKRRKHGDIMDMALWSFSIKILSEDCWECAAPEEVL